MSATLNDIINTTANNVASAYQAVQRKGGSIPTTPSLANLSSSIDGIPSGGGNVFIYSEISQSLSNQDSQDLYLLVPEGTQFDRIDFLRRCKVKGNHNRADYDYSRITNHKKWHRVYNNNDRDELGNRYDLIYVEYNLVETKDGYDKYNILFYSGRDRDRLDNVTIGTLINSLEETGYYTQDGGVSFSTLFVKGYWGLVLVKDDKRISNIDIIKSYQQSGRVYVVSAWR